MTGPRATTVNIGLTVRGILHCIKSQQFLAKQKRKKFGVMCTSAMRRSKGYVSCVTGRALQAFLKIDLIKVPCHAAQLPTLKRANIQTVFVFFDRQTPCFPLTECASWFTL